MFNFRKYTRFLILLILNLQGLQQCLGLGINSIYNVAPSDPHDNMVCSHLCDECRSQTSQAFVRNSCPFGDGSSKFFFGPKNVRSTSSCPIQAFSDNMWAYFWQFSNRFQLLLLEVLIIRAGSWNFEKLLCLCSPDHNTSRRSFEHVLPCRKTMRRLCVRFLPPWQLFSCSSRNSWLEHLKYWSIVHSFALHSRWVHPKYTWSRNDVGSSRSTSFINSFHMGSTFCFFPANLMSSTYTDRNNTCFDEQTCVSNSVFSPSKSEQNLV